MACRALLVLLASASSSFSLDLLRYTVRAEPFQVELALPDGSTQTKDMPRQPTYFFHRANFRWPVPEGPLHKRVRCEIRWTGFAPDYRLVNSFGIDERVQRFETTLERLRKAVFAGGDFRTATSKAGHILVTRTNWKFPDTEVLDYLDRFAAAQTAVWQDRGLKRHRLFLLPATASAQGESRANSAILEVPADAGSLFEHLENFAHELFHEWNSTRLHRSDDETLYWFTEGFTTYYAEATLWRLGIWSFQHVVDNFNSMARRYYTSPVRNITPTRMVEARKSSFEAERLPYQQGYLLASHWNVDGRILDRAMRYLIRDNRDPLSNARIAKSLQAAGVKTAEADIQRFIVEGKTIEPRSDLWGGCAVEAKVDIAAFDMGFEMKESRRSEVIRGVRQDSNAYRAGVRDGQKFTMLDVAHGDPSYLAEIEIEDAQGKRRVKYYPSAAAKVSVPQHKVRSVACDPFAFR